MGCSHNLQFSAGASHNFAGQHGLALAHIGEQSPQS